MSGAIADCIAAASAHNKFIAGRVKVFVRIGSDGRARWSWLPESTLGDRGAEKCITAAARAARWPAPELGGEGEAQKAFEFDPSPDERPAVTWPAERTRAALAAARGKFATCGGAGEGSFRVTAYVGTEGEVLAAGAAAPRRDAEQAADCVVDIVRTLRFPSPGSWPAKVTFDVD